MEKKLQQLAQELAKDFYIEPSMGMAYTGLTTEDLKNDEYDIFDSLALLEGYFENLVQSEYELALVITSMKEIHVGINK